MEPIRVFVVDDHHLFRNALLVSIEAETDMDVVGQAADGTEALSLIPQAQPDVVLLDLLMPMMNGWDVIAALKEYQDQISILVLSSVMEKGRILEAIQGGALGYITKETGRKELIRAIRKVAAGDPYLPPKIVGKLFHEIQQAKAHTETEKVYFKPLTPRQQDVFRLLGQGLSNSAIAETLEISQATLRIHIRNIVSKLGFENGRGLEVYAIQQQGDDMENEQKSLL